MRSILSFVYGCTMKVLINSNTLLVGCKSWSLRSKSQITWSFPHFCQIRAYSLSIIVEISLWMLGSLDINASSIYIKRCSQYRALVTIKVMHISWDILGVVTRVFLILSHAAIQTSVYTRMWRISSLKDLVSGCITWWQSISLLNEACI